MIFQSKHFAELETLKNAFNGALKFLASTKIDINKKQTPLSNLPWHLVIGPPQSGKSTLIANAGLKFILAKKAAKSTRRKAIKHTRHCDWWVTRDAAVLDTNGHFTMQTDNEGQDQALWQALLDLIKQNRKKHRIKSVIVTLSVADLLQQDEKVRRQQFQAISNRLQEVNSYLKTSVRVYVLLTKSDLLSGFSEFFNSLDKQERGQVWGLSLSADQNLSLSQSFSKSYAKLLQRLTDRVIARLHQERNIDRRSAIKDFPIQVESIEKYITEFLDYLPNANEAADDSQPRCMVQGIYFTSSKQRDLPLDQLLLPLPKNTTLQTQQLTLPLSLEHSYFAEQLFKTVIFPHVFDAEDIRVQRWQRNLRYVGYCGAASFVILSTMVFTKNFKLQLNQVSEAQKALTEYRLLSTATSSNHPLIDLTKKLNALFAATNSFNSNLFSIIKPHQKQQRALHLAVKQSYEQALKQQLFPNLITTVVQQLHQDINAKTLNFNVITADIHLYDLLYHPNHKNQEQIKHWLNHYWLKNNLSNTILKQQLLAHIENAVKLNISLPSTETMQIPRGVVLEIQRLHSYLSTLYSRKDFAHAIFVETKRRFMQSNSNDIIAQVLKNASQAPKPYDQWLRRSAEAAWQHMLITSQSYINHQWKSNVWNIYHTQLANHYPLDAHSSNDANRKNFEQVFGAQGNLFKFYNEYIKPFTETVNQPHDKVLTIVKNVYNFHWKKVNGLALRIDKKALRNFKQALQVQHDFFPQHNNQLQFRFALMASAITPNLAEFTLNIGDQQLRYPNGETSISDVYWPNKYNHHQNIHLTFKKNDGKQLTKDFSGPWALFHMLEDALVKPDKDPRRYSITLRIDDAAVNYQLIANNSENPMRAKLQQGFTLPETLFVD